MMAAWSLNQARKAPASKELHPREPKRFPGFVFWRALRQGGANEFTGAHMPALKKTSFEARVIWLGQTADRADGLESQGCDQLDLRFEGPAGEARSGLTRAACPRTSELYPENTEIRNVRQISVMSAEELAEIAQDLELDRLEPEWLGLSMVVEGLPDFTHLPPSSRLLADRGASLVVDMENLPCNIAGRAVERARPGHGIGFKQAAKGKRGVTVWVEREGVIRVGDTLRLFVPGQRRWTGES